MAELLDLIPPSSPVRAPIPATDRGQRRVEAVQVVHDEIADWFRA